MNRKHTRSTILPLAISFLSVFLRAPAASAANDSAAAQALFDEAKRLFANADYASACQKFAASQNLDPSGGTLLHLATCHENEGKTATAWSEFNEALSWARRDGRSDREAYAKAHLGALESKLVKLTIVLSVSTKGAPGLAIKRDRRPLSEAEFGIAVPVDPGDHVVEVSAPGRVTWRTVAHVDADSGSLLINIPELATQYESVGNSSEMTPPLEPKEVGDPASRSTTFRSTQRTVGIVLAASGVVGLGTGIFFDAKALSKASDRDAAARNGDAAATARLHHEAQSAQTTAFVVGGLGLAALGAGITLYFTAPKRTASLRVAPSVAANAWGLSVELSQ